MTQDEYIKLSEKYLSGSISSDELKLLQEHDTNFMIRFYAEEEKIPAHTSIGKEIFERVEKDILKLYITKRRRTIFFQSAAAITFFLATGLILWKANQKPKAQVAQHYYQADVEPGKTKAVLTLANGQTVVLNNAQNGVLAVQGNVAVTKQSNGRISYNTAKNKLAGNAKEAFNTISVPRGGQYQVVLPDGTNVWLNSATTLKYPVAFNGNQRNVELNGEAYFEVTKNKAKPFNVMIGDAKVHVLGTHFDVSNYVDELVVKTTLIEGSVKLTKKTSEALLKPGQQGSFFVSADKIVVNEANVEDALAWKNDYFVFRHENIKSIMKRVARWYDVDVEYQGNMDNKRFGGSLSRFKNLSELLHNMELTGLVHFKIEGRRLPLSLKHTSIKYDHPKLMPVLTWL